MKCLVTTLRSMVPHRASAPFLVAIAVFVVLGHICAAPFHAHAGALTTHSEDHPEGGSGEAAHGGSCEALKTTSNVDLPLLPSARIEIVFPFELFGRPTIAASVPAPDTSPPLFLLHATLLI